MFIILKMGDTMRECAQAFGDFEDWTLKAMDIEKSQILVIDVKKQNFPSLQNIHGIVITGSHDMVTDDLPWLKTTSAWLKNAAEKNIPILGICFGHQLLAQTFGGVVGDHPEGPEIGTVGVNLNDEAKNDALFRDLPETFLAHVTHTQSVLKLPETAKLLASNCYEPCHAFRIGERVWGVQFHPEHDTNIIKEYVKAQANVLKNAFAVLRDICDTPYANSIVKRFVKFCVERD